MKLTSFFQVCSASPVSDHCTEVRCFGAAYFGRRHSYLLLMIVAAVLIFAVLPASGQVTYTYTGRPFTSFAGRYACPPQCSITGSFTVPTALAPNGSYFLYAYGGAPTISTAAFSFTDGVFTFTNANATGNVPREMPTSGIVVGTDSSGNISSWQITLINEQLSFAMISISSADDSVSDCTFDSIVGLGCGGSLGVPSYALGSSGSWTSSSGSPPAQPSPPTDLHANQIGLSGTQVQLTWNYGSDPIDGFKIERKTPSGTWIELPYRPSSSERSYIDISDPVYFPSYATYSYRIRAYLGMTLISAYTTPITAFQISVSSRQCNKGQPCGPRNPVQPAQITRSYLINTFKPLLDCMLCETE
jgi:hypothetical protein